MVYAAADFIYKKKQNIFLFSLNRFQDFLVAHKSSFAQVILNTAQERRTIYFFIFIHAQNIIHRIYPSFVLVQHRKSCPYITERLLMGHKESNQTKQNRISFLAYINININNA